MGLELHQHRRHVRVHAPWCTARVQPASCKAAELLWSPLSTSLTSQSTLQMLLNVVSHFTDNINIVKCLAYITASVNAPQTLSASREIWQCALAASWS